MLASLFGQLCINNRKFNIKFKKLKAKTYWIKKVNLIREKVEIIIKIISKS